MADSVKDVLMCSQQYISTQNCSKYLKYIVIRSVLDINVFHLLDTCSRET